MLFENWDITGFDRDKAANLCRNNINPLVSVLFASRGITEPGDVKAFIDAENAPWHDPFLMADMDKAVARIKKAVESKEIIAIYGDYDVDGMTSTALLALWLESKNVRYDIYIPGRFDEGYGLHTEALETLKSRGIDLVISVDCGIVATAEAQHAKDIGLGLVITDHHECKENLPVADAVIDPKRNDCAYPFKDLAGVGVVFKLICALEGANRSDDLFATYGHLAALGTVADVMPVTGENRKIIISGLRQINTSPGPGLRGLIDKVCSEPYITASTISYTLAPRFNAAGRMSDPLLSVRLLLSKNAEEAAQYVSELDRLNDERRKLEQDVLDMAMAELGGEEPRGPLILAGEGWYQGVTGIVASRLADRYRLPVIIISISEDGCGRGSCRSYGGFSIYDALCSCEDLLLNFGGHDSAAGFDLHAGNIDEFRRRVTAFFGTVNASTPRGDLKVDFEATLPEQLLTLQNVEALKCLEPYGNDHRPPCICIKGAQLIGMTSVGSGKHTKLKVMKSGQVFDCIFFSVSSERLGIAEGDIVDIAFEPLINEFRGRKSVQLQMTDIRKNED